MLINFLWNHKEVLPSPHGSITGLGHSGNLWIWSNRKTICFNRSPCLLLEGLWEETGCDYESGHWRQLDHIGALCPWKPLYSNFFAYQTEDAKPTSDNEDKLWLHNSSLARNYIVRATVVLRHYCWKWDISFAVFVEICLCSLVYTKGALLCEVNMTKLLFSLSISMVVLVICV